jgi:nucleotide-binding universal stress UspA family protein
VLYVWSGAAAEHARIPADGVEAVWREMREEVRCAARHKAAAVATESAEMAHNARLEARPPAVESDDGPANAIMQAAASESAAAVVIGRTSRTRLGRLLTGSFPRHITSHSPAPVLLA